MKFIILGILLIALSACSAFNRRADQNDKTIEAPLANADAKDDAPSMSPPQDAPTDDSKPLTDNIASPMAEAPVSDQPENETLDVTLQKKSYLDEKYHEPKSDILPAAQRTESTYSGTSSGVDPDKALGWLKNGNKRFLKGSLRADGQSRKDIQRLAKAEKPHAVIFTTSDSRISPEIIFDEKLGEIYVIRNLGLSVDTSVLNTVDYAIGELGTRLIIVLDRSYPGKQMDFSHADETSQKLFDQSTILKTALESKQVKVISAIYDIETGKVIFGK
ncbi:MAG: carbonic anhydrase [Bdellovibrionota bacterium]